MNASDSPPSRAPKHPAAAPVSHPAAAPVFHPTATLLEATSLDQLVHPSWVQPLQPAWLDLQQLAARLRAELAAGNQIAPPPAQILRAFTYPFDQVRVLIVGQDPYPTRGHANGLSFSVTPGTPIPRSLRNIFTELEADLGIPAPVNGDLRPWSEQGVMLLNNVLTVAIGAPQAHAKWGWQRVTECAIRALVARNQPLVAILWGRQAQALTPLLQGTTIIASPHPSPLSASRGFFGSRPFSRTNAALQQQGSEAIDWRLDQTKHCDDPLVFAQILETEDLDQQNERGQLW